MGVAVVIEAQHMCMQIRGIQKQNSVTTTSAFTGIFLDNLNTREELFILLVRSCTRKFPADYSDFRRNIFQSETISIICRKEYTFNQMKAYVFPGQGAQFPGMGKDLYDRSSYAGAFLKKPIQSLDSGLPILCLMVLMRILNRQK